MTQPEVGIVAWGSPFGDDRLGWEAIAALRDVIGDEPRIDLRVCDRSGTTAITQWQDYAGLILIDAMQGGAAIGTIHRLDARTLPAEARALSTHGMGLAETLALARTLGVLPAASVIYGIEIGAIIDGGLSAAIEAKLPELVTQVATEARRMLAHVCR